MQSALVDKVIVIIATLTVLYTYIFHYIYMLSR